MIWASNQFSGSGGIWAWTSLQLCAVEQVCLTYGPRAAFKFFDLLKKINLIRIWIRSQQA